MNKTNIKIERTDIVRLKTISEYEGAGDEITELVEKFAGHYVKVLGIEDELNEFGEHTYMVTDINSNNDIVTVTDHEIAIVYKAQAL